MQLCLNLEVAQKLGTRVMDMLYLAGYRQAYNYNIINKKCIENYPDTLFYITFL